MAAYYAPDEMVKMLQVSDSTLRKYALLLEKAGYEIHKNGQGQRWYRDADVMALRKFMTFTKSGGMTLEEAAQAVFTWSKGGEIARSDTAREAPPPAISEMAEKLFDKFEEMTSAIDRQEQQHKQDMEQVNAAMQQQAEEMAAMRALLEKMEAEKETAAALPPPEDEKKGFWRRIFG